jgi:hypothetical protein
MLINKPLIVTFMVSLSFNLAFGYLSYSFYSDKAVAEVQLATAVKANKDLKESLDKKEAACLVMDENLAGYIKEKQEIVKETDGVLNAIDKLPSVPVQVESKPKRQENAKEQTADKQTNIVSLDGKLSDDLVRLLSESCSRARGSTCDSP